jgi:hypothetical protein
LAHSAEARAALASTYAQAVAAVLGPGNVQQLAALREYRGAAAGRLVTALHQVWPEQAGS